MIEAVRLRPRIGRPVNTKLGPGIFSWSLTAGATCPGATEACLASCYAMRGRFRMGNLKHLYERNHEFSGTDEFVPWMTSQLVAKSVETLRIHVAGDFYDADYIEKWRQIIRRHPRVRFFGYTRSWSVAECEVGLRQLAKLANLRLWYSADLDSGMPARVPKEITGVAWLARTDEEADSAPPGCQLVFRDHPSTVMRKTQTGVRVCPYETGALGFTRPTCTICKICYR